MKFLKACDEAVCPAPSRITQGFFKVPAEQHKDAFSNSQAVNPEAEAEVDRRSADWAVTAMTAALRLLTGNRYLRIHLIGSAEDREIEAVKNQLWQAIVRRRRNLRRQVGRERP